MRTIVFLGIFIIFSGIIGPRIISHGLINQAGFEFYGGAGKALLFGVLALLLLLWHARKPLPRLESWHWRNLSWIVLLAVCLIGTWIGVGYLINGSHMVLWPVLTHACLLSGVMFAAMGVFGTRNLHILFAKYKREVGVALLLAVGFFGFLYLVYGLWTYLAAAVLHAVQWLLERIGLHSTLLPPRTLLFDKFGINIAETCSGIESIALFSAFYALVGVLDWPRLNHRKLFYMFVPALLVLFGFNILRVALLILAGYYINPRIAFSLFHTYAGMLFFILYSILFWAVCYDFMLDGKSTEASLSGRAPL